MGAEEIENELHDFLERHRPELSDDQLDLLQALLKSTDSQKELADARRLAELAERQRVTSLVQIYSDASLSRDALAMRFMLAGMTRDQALARIKTEEAIVIRYLKKLGQDIEEKSEHYKRLADAASGKIRDVPGQ